MVLLLLVIGLLTVLVLAGVGYLVVRASLRPLVEVERTAAAIASGDLSSRVAEGDPRTEVGQLSAALNGMLAQIETAFAEREASEEDARRSEQRMRRFVADASHELRTPLTSIRGFAELFRQGAVTEPAEVRRAFRRIEDEAAHMGLLVEDLLMLARLDQQRPLDRSPVDLLPLATDAVEDARAVQPERPVRLELGNIDPPPVVTGDEARLRQVLRNLVGNALQHTPGDTPVVVRVSTCAANGVAPGRVLLEVADEGPGMKPEDMARVFERFYRADPSRNRSDGGTGLGLAIAGALAAVHGGTITLDTAPGKGARFCVELPLAAAEAE
jgi:two-component system OmpR family sensor kinase